jgi:putative transposase
LRAAYNEPLREVKEMTRPLRIEFPGAVYYVTSRGNAGMPIYEDDIDRAVFLSLLARVVDRFNWVLHAYCLMDDHYHLIVETLDANLSGSMRQLNGIYTQASNRRHGRGGHLLQGRYGAILVDRQRYLPEVCRYVVLNPVRAGIVASAQDYNWSSYRFGAGLDPAPRFLSCEWIHARFGGARETAMMHYREFVAAGLRASSPWKNLKGQLLLGEAALIPEKNRPSTITAEVTREQRFVGRPSLAALFGKPNKPALARRNINIVQAVLRYGYSQTAVAKHLNLHCSSVSKVIKELTSNSRFKT